MKTGRQIKKSELRLIAIVFGLLCLVSGDYLVRSWYMPKNERVQNQIRAHQVALVKCERLRAESADIKSAHDRLLQSQQHTVAGAQTRESLLKQCEKLTRGRVQLISMDPSIGDRTDRGQMQVALNLEGDIASIAGYLSMMENQLQASFPAMSLTADNRAGNGVRCRLVCVLPMGSSKETPSFKEN